MTAAQGSSLVSFIGVSNTVARVILGAISQKLNRLFLYNTCLVICGITMAVSNYLQPVTASLAGVNCAHQLVELTNNVTMESVVSNVSVIDVANATQNATSWYCDPYYGQFIYVNCYGVTR